MFLASNLEKLKENQCFWLRTLNGCVPPFASAPSLARLLPQSLPPPFAGREPLIVKIYIHKLPIHRTYAAG